MSIIEVTKVNEVDIKTSRNYAYVLNGAGNAVQSWTEPTTAEYVFVTSGLVISTTPAPA